MARSGLSTGTKATGGFRLRGTSSTNPAKDGVGPRSNPAGGTGNGAVNTQGASRNGRGPSVGGSVNGKIR